jgi:glycosyltransferase involved in cell wall biosynthesis
MDLTRVSVVLPALNEAAALPVALASFPAQADLVVVDNGSTDATARWLAPADPDAAPSRDRRDCNHQPP